MALFPRIVFFGTPDFAVASLAKLTDSGFPVVAVVTAPDKPAGRGLKEKVSPVKEFALLNGIPVLQPPNMKDPMFLQQLSEYKPDLQIVIAFRMMPKLVWALPPLGTFNLHASLLPQYRGAAPINWAIINGEQETGVTTFFLNEHIDCGKILLTQKVTIHPHETAGELHDRLMTLGAGVVLQTVNLIVAGNFTETSQEILPDGDPQLKAAPKIFRDDCMVNWNQDVKSVHNFIRGLSPHPCAFTNLTLPDGSVQSLRILRSSPGETDQEPAPGQFFTDGKSFLKVSAKNGFIYLNEVQLSGRKAMNTVDFLRGYRSVFPETRAI